jgi:hypothetical protein
MFVAAERTLDMPCQAAGARLANLVYAGGLNQPSHAAYQQGLNSLIRVGPLGHLPGASKLVRVDFLDPVQHDGAVSVGFRWQATGATAGLFPVLDADVTVGPAGQNHTRLALAGTYRAPLGRVGASLDRAILHLVATATVRTLLTDIAATLSSSTPTAAVAADGHARP